MQISKILSMVNETENAGRIAIRSDEKEDLQAFLEKNIYLQNEVLKFRRDITSEKQLYIVNDFTTDMDYNLYLSVRNIEKTFVLMPNEISVYWLLKSEKIVITKEALLNIEEVLG